MVRRPIRRRIVTRNHRVAQGMVVVVVVAITCDDAIIPVMMMMVMTAMATIGRSRYLMVVIGRGNIVVDDIVLVHAGRCCQVI